MYWRLKKPAALRNGRALLLLLLVWLLGSCATLPNAISQTPSSLDTHGFGAGRIADLWWVMFGLGTLIYVLVIVLMAMALLRRRRATTATHPDMDNKVGKNWLIWGGIVLPLAVLVPVFGFTIHTLALVSDPPQNPPLTVEVVGRQWWWEVNYKTQGFATGNELHIPVKTPVQLVLKSADVIHSFWVPQLHGKMDLIPGTINNFIIEADDEGVYRGECAEYCGLQHAHMGFMVVAESQDKYDQWAARQQQPAAAAQDETTKQGQKVFLDAGCVFCHTVRGLDDKSIDASAVDLGPDLTHIGSRLAIGAGTLPNNTGSLAGWVVDAQHIKPGSQMPPIHLEGNDLQALLAYLQSLT
jgi:cytochrome c oxidase subunit 2